MKNKRYSCKKSRLFHFTQTFKIAFIKQNKKNYTAVASHLFRDTLGPQPPHLSIVWQVASPRNKSRTLHDDWKDANPDKTGKQHGYA